MRIISRPRPPPIACLWTPSKSTVVICTIYWSVPRRHNKGWWKWIMHGWINWEYQHRIHIVAN
ncbi:hypothetical protein BCR42DRAFT_421333 [Absidia repens]|uniref:Uncharacterized protein n=1 Tax=Absidia repens TaxID=90262 RepID=A0A1X2I8G9_9FUNG|nr:hypothetical protein BCR42DRAFT_421333 [Absidia repens]